MAESGRKAVIKNADMAEDMQQDAVEVATAVRTADGDSRDVAGRRPRREILERTHG